MIVLFAEKYFLEDYRVTRRVFKQRERKRERGDRQRDRERKRVRPSDIERIKQSRYLYILFNNGKFNLELFLFLDPEPQYITVDQHLV